MDLSVATAAVGVGALVWIAFVLDLAGFLARDELWLRLLMLAASAFYLVYYYIVADAPLWDAIFTNGALALANVAMILVVITERSTIGMPTEVARLYSHFPLLTPGQFRRLWRNCTEVTADADTPLVTQGTAPDALFYIVDGEVRIEKSGTVSCLQPGTFIGEIAFLTGQPATATVVAGPGVTFLRWERPTLDRLFARAPSLRAALLGHLNLDLARKVAQSLPG